MPATRLSDTQAFGPVLPGASVVITHGLFNGEIAVEPDIVALRTTGKFTVVATDLTVTLTNAGSSTESGEIFCWWQHSVLRAFGDVANKDLSIKPFVIGGGSDEDDESSLTYVYAPLNPLGRHANVYIDFNDLMSDYAVRDQTLGTGIISFDGAYLPGPFPQMVLPPKAGGGDYDISNTVFSSPSDGPFLSLQFADDCTFTWSGIGAQDVPMVVFAGFRTFLCSFAPSTSIPFKIPDGAGVSFAGLYQPCIVAPGASPLFQAADGGFAVLSCGNGYHQGLGFGPGGAVLDCNGAFIRFENINTDDGGIGDFNAVPGLALIFCQERTFEAMSGFEGLLSWTFPDLPSGTQIAHELVPRTRYRMNFWDPEVFNAAFNPPVVHTEGVGLPYQAHYNELVLCNTAEADVGVLLPTAIWPQGEKITIKIQSGANDVVVTPPAAQTIDGGASHTLAGGTKGSVSFVTDGFGNWVVIDKSVDNT